VRTPESQSITRKAVLQQPLAIAGVVFAAGLIAPHRRVRAFAAAPNRADGKHAINEIIASRAAVAAPAFSLSSGDASPNAAIRRAKMWRQP